MRRGASDPVGNRHRKVRRSASHQRFVPILATVILQAVFLSATDLRADVLVRGNSGAVEVTARDASIVEVLSALNTSFGLRYRGAAPLEQRVTGTHAGSLREVIKWLLRGYDFVLMTKSGATELVIIRATDVAGTHTVAPQR